jgi:hypothetical protein
VTRLLFDNYGQAVRLTDERLLHILEHQEMRGVEGFIEKTLEQPQLVVQSQSDPDCHLFYRLLLRTRVGRKWLCVVVKYCPADAFVLTAYLTDKPKKGVQLWPSK